MAAEQGARSLFVGLQDGQEVPDVALNSAGCGKAEPYNGLIRSTERGSTIRAMSKRGLFRGPSLVVALALATLGGGSCGGGTLTPPGEKSLHGIWSGQVSVSAPGLAWGPFDALTLGFADDGTLSALQFAGSVLPPHTFGSGPDDYPLEGSRQAPLTAGSSFTVQVTVNAANFASDDLDFSYRITGVGDSPDTDYVEETKGQLQNGVLHVSYSATGTYLIVPIAATASGDLRQQ